jgi:hypothetical protein
LESELHNLKSEIHQKANSYELREKADKSDINQVNNRVDNLEYTIGQIRTNIDEILSRLQKNEENQLIKEEAK